MEAEETAMEEAANPDGGAAAAPEGRGDAELEGGDAGCETAAEPPPPPPPRAVVLKKVPVKQKKVCCTPGCEQASPRPSNPTAHPTHNPKPKPQPSTLSPKPEP